MERVASCRRAAHDAVSDVEPPGLHGVIADVLDDASMTPGVLTVESAVAIDADADVDGIVHRAAGVQLIYEGLRLTRRLAHEEPWTGVTANGRADLEILAADILVARGFYLLARTAAAGKAVRTVQAFGRDQTLREDASADADRLDGNLERHVLELAVLAGAAAVNAKPTPTLLGFATDLGEEVGPAFPPAPECIPEFGKRSGEAPIGDGRPTDRATSATDP